MTAEEFLKKADRLRSARLLLDDGDTASSVSRSYYAMFYAAEAALLDQGIDVKSHAGLINRFGETLVKDGPLAPSMGRDLSRVFKERQHSEYDVGDPMPEQQARNALETAQRFVERIREHLQ